MSAQMKTLLLASVLLPLIFNSVSDCSAKVKKRTSKAASAGVAYTPGGHIVSGGEPKWVQYDHGGMYYYQKREYEKAKKYWLESLKEAEAVVPRERARGLSKKTEQDCCGLLQHLTMMVKDTQLNPDTTGKYGASFAGGDPVRRQYDMLAETQKKIRQDGRWLDRVENFANRAIGKDSYCMRNLSDVRGRMNIDLENNNFTMKQMEQQLKISQSAVDPRGVNRNPTSVGPNSGLAPNGEYIPPGQQTPTGGLNPNP